MRNQQIIVRNPSKLTEWERRISACRSSGKTVQDWCADNELAIKTFYYWNNKINKLHRNENSAENTFYEIYSGAATPCDGIIATVEHSGIRAAIHSGADEETLTSMFRALKSC